MTTAAQTFQKKSLYHSDLAKHGEIVVQFAGEPRDSQYPNKPRWVGLLVHGDDTKYTLNIENADVENTIKNAPKNAWLSVRAEGRGDQAFMLVEDGNGGPILKGDTTPPRPAFKPAPPRQDGPPANEWTDEEQAPVDSKAQELRRTLADRYYIALCAADDAVQRFAADHHGAQPSDAVRNVATTLFIQASGR